MDDFILPLSYAPDGLYESDVDALIAEYFGADVEADIDAAPSMPVDRVAEHRHARREHRHTINAALRALEVNSPSQDRGEAA